MSKLPHKEISKIPGLHLFMAEDKNTGQRWSFLFQFDHRALNQSLKEQEAKQAADTKPLVAEAPKINGSGEDQEDEDENDDDDDSDLDIDNL